ncbi:MAG TPA: DPP IV N-terminal domain-containing protein, partial [Pyrinomonadaceae bacterium]|nr:DPP IV N-terminal domain-containing protein [Pyrinomonadaceae bacterium]
MLRLFSAVMLVALACVVCPAQPFTGPLLFSRVAVNRTHVAFSYAGDLWVVERAGGEARRLTTHAGEDNFPCFSPDGSQLAFSRQINNDWDIYVMPAEGGEARRLTYMPEDDLAAGWTPDGRSVLFNSHRDEEGVIRLWKIGLDGVTAEPLPLPQAYAGSYSP